MPAKNLLARWVTFEPNLKHAIHNWFYFKEGFAKELVEWLIDEYSMEEPIYDPFCGAGTTLLVAKQLGFDSVGIDVMPLAVFLSKVKTRNYDVSKLKETLALLSSERIAEAKQSPKAFKRYFRGKSLREILGLKERLEQLSDHKLRDFFMLALICAANKIALVKKQGRSLRRVKKPYIPAKKVFLKKAAAMIKDLEKVKLSKKEPEVFEADASEFYLKKKAASIICSPPYLNKEEYTSVYKLEHGLFFGYETTKLKKYLGKERELKQDKYAKLPIKAQLYFADMEKVLENMYKSLKENGLAAVVINGGCFSHTIVKTSELFEDLAKEKGFNVVERILARRVPCMRNRSKLVGFMHEDILILEK